MQERKDVTQITSQIKESPVSDEARSWLMGEAENIADLVNVYIADPDKYGLHPDLIKKPELIVETILHSADLLHSYQIAYNQALARVAEANDVESSNLDNVPELLEAASIQREIGKVNELFQNPDAKLAIGLMGTGASGKGTIGKRSGMDRAVNVTTRPKRPTEEHGKDYLYIRIMEPQTEGTLDIDTGLNVVGHDPATSEPIYETDAHGTPINYFDKYGPYVAIAPRPGRALHGTPTSEFKRLYDSGLRSIFFEHGPEHVKQAIENLSEQMPDVQVLPVCILPPKRGIIALATRLAVRTYGDKGHQDTSFSRGFRIEDKYLESTIGLAQIKELEMTGDFVKGKGSPELGIVYIVNDDLDRAVEVMKHVVTPPDSKN